MIIDLKIGRNAGFYFGNYYGILYRLERLGYLLGAGV